MTIAARYENGVFKPLHAVALDEGTIVELQVPERVPARPRSIRELGFVGMWSGREDIPDGVTYVNQLRDKPRG